MVSVYWPRSPSESSSPALAVYETTTSGASALPRKHQEAEAAISTASNFLRVAAGSTLSRRATVHETTASCVGGAVTRHHFFLFNSVSQHLFDVVAAILVQCRTAAVGTLCPSTNGDIHDGLAAACKEGSTQFFDAIIRLQYTRLSCAAAFDPRNHIHAHTRTRHSPR